MTKDHHPDLPATGRTDRQRWLATRIAAILGNRMTPSEIAAEMERHVIGQDDTLRALAVVLHQHLTRNRARQCGDVGAFGIPRSAVLLIGPTGCGKSLCIQTLAHISQVCHVTADGSRLTDEGYVGSSISDVLARLLQRAAMSTSLASQSIIALDEIDKLRTVPQHTTRDVSGAQVQHEILSLLESPEQEVPIPSAARKSTGGPATITLDTSRVLVILAGAFVGLDDIIERRVRGRKRMGFGNAGVVDVSRDGRPDLLQQLEPEDLIEYGMIPELVGRLTDICVLRPLAKADLKRIMVDARGGPLKTTQRLAELHGFGVRLTMPLVDRIVDEAERSGLGARGLLSSVRRATRRAFFEMPDLMKGRIGYSPVVTFGAPALKDGSYSVEWGECDLGRGNGTEAEEGLGELEAVAD